ncbi:hypothetical protein ACXZ66_06005 [Corynebacterium sp. S7]
MRQRTANYKDLVNDYLPVLLKLYYEQRRIHELIEVLFDWADNVPYLQLEASAYCDGHQQLTARLDRVKIFSLRLSPGDVSHYEIHQRLRLLEPSFGAPELSFSDDAYPEPTGMDAPF